MLGFFDTPEFWDICDELPLTDLFFYDILFSSYTLLIPGIFLPFC